MTPPLLLFAVVAVYSLGVLAMALAVESRRAWRERVAGSPVVYALSLAVFSTTWTYYGSVGLAARSGFLFMAVCLGVVISATLWWTVLRRIVRIKSAQRITSIADFVSARYNRSQLVALLVTVGALVGSLPYVALQMKAILSTLALAAVGPAGVDPPWMDAAGPGLVLYMALFTILVGVRRLDPTERHQGVIFAVAVESVVKLVAMLAVGVFVTWGMFDGLGDVFARVAGMAERPMTGLGGPDGRSYLSWMSLLILSTSAVLFLPRQFHVAAVENSDERHILTAMWLFPLYYLLANVFVFPIAMAGLLSGLPAGEADTFVLRLPFMAGHGWLGVLVFLGGLSAGMSMIVISAMTMAVMITNHVVLPVVEVMPSFAGLRRFLLQCRWVVVTAYLGLGYAFYRMVGDAYILVNMGILSFAAALQLVPAILGGLFWRGANRAGALAGIGAGLAVWAYTMLVPAFVRSGWLPHGILETGPLGLAWLNPEGLFGLTVLDSLSHSVFWSLLVNTGAFVLRSLAVESTEEEEGAAARFVDALALVPPRQARAEAWEAHVPLERKRSVLRELFSVYYGPQRAKALADACVRAAGLTGAEAVNIRQLMALYSEAERVLAGVIGSAAAYKTMRQGHLYSPRETMELSEVYAGILADLKLSPEDLAERVDYYQEREALLSRHSEELEEANERLLAEVEERRRAQEEMREAEQKFRGIFENAVEGIFRSTPQGGVVDMNPAALRIFGYDSVERMRREVTNLGTQHYVDPRDRERYLQQIKERGVVNGFETRLRAVTGEVRWVELSARGIFDESGELVALEGFLQDIGDRKRAEQELMRANRHIESIIESMPSAMVALDGAGRVSLLNRAAEQVLGMEADEARGMLLGEVHPALDGVQGAVARAQSEQRPVPLGRRWRRTPGGVRHEEVVIYPLDAGEGGGVVVRLDDVTERVMMEEVMIQSEKMMSVGGLAAGMAHEINNPLGGILQGVQNIERRVVGDLPANRRAAEELGCDLESVRAYFTRRGIMDMLAGIRESGERAATIVSNMLEFSRRSDASRALVDLRELLDKTVDLAGKDYDLKKSYDFRKVRIVREYCDEPATVWCSAVEIEQVVFNLLKNAAQAMAQDGAGGDGPTITLGVAVEENMVRVEIRDNGPGMDEATRRRVFEPFFTTKETGQGTGLGLSVSYFIVTGKHGGRFTVRTETGKGAAFIFHLPLHGGTDEEQD